MPIFQIAEEILDRIAEHAEKEALKSLKVRCPRCGGPVLKKELEKRGCYLCGWKPTDEANTTKSVVLRKPGADETTKSGAGPERPKPYRTRCTRCGAMVVTKQLLEKGCYVCGLKPIALSTDYPLPTTTTREDEERAKQRELEERLRQELTIELDELREGKGK